MAFALRPKVLAGVRRVVTATRCHAGRWLAVRPVAGGTTRIDVDVEAVVARRQAEELRRDLQARVGVGQRADLLANAADIDREETAWGKIVKASGAKAD